MVSFRSLQALLATSELHSVDDAASRVLPSVAPLAVDPIPDVRAASLSCMDAFMGVLKSHNRAMEAEAAAAPAASESAKQDSGWSGNLSNMGWALSGLGLSRGTGASASSTDVAGASAPAVVPPPSPPIAKAARVAAAAPAADYEGVLRQPDVSSLVSSWLGVVVAGPGSGWWTTRNTVDCCIELQS